MPTKETPFLKFWRALNAEFLAIPSRYPHGQGPDQREAAYYCHKGASVADAARDLYQRRHPYREDYTPPPDTRSAGEEATP